MMRQRQTKQKKLKDTSQSQTSPAPGEEDGIQTSVTPTSRSVCRRCLGCVKYLILVILIPPFLNYASLHRESNELQPPGALYDIGFGQKLFLSCEGSGEPTVLLDAPTGMNSDVWGLVQPELAKITKVCVYDRAGLGFSDKAPVNYSVDPSDELAFNYGNKWQKSTVERMVDDLHSLVTYSSQQHKPFILVGAELGAMVARFYAHIYESEVSDLVLIDPVVENLFQHDDGVWANIWFRHLLPYFQAHQMAAALGLTRLGVLLRLMAPPLSTDNMPPEVTTRQKYLMCNPRHLSSVVDEYHFINDSMSQLQTLYKIKQFPGNISTTVINGNYFDEQLPSQLNKAWAKSQQWLLTELHPNSNHIVVNGADHHMLYRHPHAVIDPVKRLVKHYRNRHKNTHST